jgi:flagellar basal body rod protein FlgG
VQVSASTERALDYITERARDVQAAFTPGAIPAFDDVANQNADVRASFNPLDVALPEGSYLLSSDEDGRVLYTRDGGLCVRDGVVMTAAGSPALGFSPTGGASTGPLAIDGVDRALGRVVHLRVDADGSVAYDRAMVDPLTGARNMQRVVVGQLALARFPAATKLGIVDAERVAAPPGVVPYVGRAGDGNFGTLAPLRRAESRIDFDRSLDKLKEAYVAFDAVSAAHKAQGNLGKTTMDLLK